MLSQSSNSFILSLWMEKESGRRQEGERKTVREREEREKDRQTERSNVRILAP